MAGSVLAGIRELVRSAGCGAWISTIEFHQTNHEGVLLDWVHEAQAKGATGIDHQSRRPHPYVDRPARRRSAPSACR